MSNFLTTATKADRTKICQLLAEAFDDNPSANDTIKQDAKRSKRMLALMEYAFDIGIRRNGVFKSADGNGAAILFNPKKFPTRFSDLLLQIKLIHHSIGWNRLVYMLKKDKQLRSHHPAEEFLYLFFIGTTPAAQGSGTGTKMMSAIREYAVSQNLPVVLETSVAANVPFYEKRGFIIYANWHIRHGYHMRFMKMSVK